MCSFKFFDILRKLQATNTYGIEAVTDANGELVMESHQEGSQDHLCQVLLK